MKPKPGASIWVISCGESNYACATQAHGAVDAAEAAGWDVKIYDANFGIGDGFNVGIRQAIAAGADGIIVTVDCQAAKSGLEEAKAAGIPVVSFATDCKEAGVGEDLFAADFVWNKDMPSTREYFERWAAARADWTINATDGQAKVIAFQLTGAAAGEYLLDGFTEELSLCEDCEIVATVDFNPADISSGALKTAFASTLLAHPEANAVFALWDPIVLASDAGQTLTSTGRADVFLVGGEGFADNIAQIRENRGEDAAAGQDATLTGWGLTDTLIRVLADQEPIPVGQGFRLIDAEHNLPPEGEAYTTDVDYQSAFKKMWGVD